MKVDDKKPEAAAPQPKQSFKAVLSKPKTPLVPRPAPPKPHVAGSKPNVHGRVPPKAVAAVKPALVRSAQRLEVVAAHKTQLARSQKASVTADEVLARGHAQARALDAGQAKDARRKSDLTTALQVELRREDLKEQPELEPRPAEQKVEGAAELAAQKNGASQQPAEAQRSSSADRAQAIAAMVEKVEYALKHGQPQLTVSLGKGLASEVEVVRVGKGEVRLAVSCRSPSERAKLRDLLDGLEASLAGRGLKLAALDVR